MPACRLRGHSGPGLAPGARSSTRATSLRYTRASGNSISTTRLPAVSTEGDSSGVEGGNAGMKDVGWGDFLIALVVAPILVLPVVGAVYLLLFVALGSQRSAYSGWLQVTI